MNPFVFACMTPHGSEIVEELSTPHPQLMLRTRNSMEVLGEKMRKAEPETIILLTPHGTRIDGQFSIADSERMEGSVEDHGGTIHMERQVDRELARAICREAKDDGIAAATINFGTTAGPYSCLTLDWGATIPLWYMPKVPVVVITPSRLISFADHIKFGKALARAVQSSGKKVALIASCDWAHAHDAEGPYGFDPAAKELDDKVVTLIKENRLSEMAQFDSDWVEAAKPDGIWQTLILDGAIPAEEREVQFLSYEAPTYFGMICAAFEGRS